MKLLIFTLCFLPFMAFSRPLIEVKMGYFFFTESVMKQVYDEGGFDGQISGSYPIYNVLHLYGSIEYLEKSGYSLNGNQKTSISEIPLSLGIKPVFFLKPHAEYYFALGPRYFFTIANNRSAYVSKHMNANGLGGFMNTGFLFRWKNNFTFDLFAEYSYGKLHFHSSVNNSQGHAAQVGGLACGGGLGYSF